MADQDPLSEKDINSFLAVKEFVSCLHKCFGQKNMKLALYNRLVETTKTEDPSKEDVDRVRGVLDGFKLFCDTHSNLIVTKNLAEIPRGVKICYKNKENISIEIKHFVSNSTSDIKDAISAHLLNITAYLGNQDALASIDEILKDEMNKPSAPPGKSDNEARSLQDLKNIGIDSNTAEGKFIHDILSKTQNSFAGGAIPENPAAAAMMLLSSGVFQDITTDLSTGVQSGKLDVRKLFSMMQNTLNSVLPESTPQIEEVKTTSEPDTPTS